MSGPQRLRVLHFYSHYHPDSFGGVETAINQIVRGMAEQGVQSTVLALSPNAQPTRIEIDGHPVVRAPIQWAVSSNRFGLKAIPLLRALARDADVLHCHFPWPFGDLAVLASGVRKPFIVTYHSDIVRQRVLGALYAPLREVFLSRAAAIVATSPQYARSSRVLARHHKRVHVIPLGLDPAGPSAPPAALRQKWRERIPGRFFLFVGMLRYYKGLPYAIEALRGTDMRLVILGAGPMEAALKKQAASLPAGQVLFVGPLPDEDKFALLGACEALIMPSHLRSEAFGLSLLEGAAFSKPLISCELATGTTFVNVDNVTGLVARPADVPSLRQAMLRLWTDSALAHRLGQGARARLESHFDQALAARAYAKLYRDVACGSRQACLAY